VADAAVRRIDHIIKNNLVKLNVLMMVVCAFFGQKYGVIGVNLLPGDTRLQTNRISPTHPY